MYFENVAFIMNKKYEKQIEDAIKDRAIMYYYLYEEIEKKFDTKAAKEIFKKAVYRRGIDKSKKYSEICGDLNKVADLFVTSSPSGGKIFKPKKIKADKNTAILTMRACPLVNAWRKLRLSKNKIKLMCDLAREIDFGTFESAGLKLKFAGTIGAGAKCCRLELNK